MKDQVKTPLIVVTIVAVVAVLFFFGSKAMSAGDLDQGQVQYTPGVPPWADKNRKPAPMSPDASNVAAPPQPNGSMPAGMTAPAINNSGSK